MVGLVRLHTRPAGLTLLLAGMALTLAACGSTGDSVGVPDTASSSVASTTAGVDEETPGTRGPRPAPNPVSLALTFDESTSVTDTIGPDGGSLTASLPAGGTATLTIPEEALLSDVEITMTPIVSVGAPIQADVAGVRLEPEGLRFLRMVELDVLDPRITTDWAAVGTENDGAEAHLIPADTRGGSSLVAFNHFSTWSLVDGQLVEIIEQHTPSDDQDFWEGELDEADRTLDGESFSYYLETFAGWADDLARRMETIDNETELEHATGEMSSLLFRLEQQIAQYRSQGNEFTLEQLESRVDYLQVQSWWTIAMIAAIEEALADCTGSDGPVAAFRAKRWIQMWRSVARNSDLIEINTNATDRWDGPISDCLTFEVTWRMNVDFENVTIDRRWAGEFAARAVIASGPEQSILPLSEGLTSPIPENQTRVALKADRWLEENPLDDVDQGFKCTPELGEGEVEIGLIMDLDIPNLGDVSASRILGYFVSIEPTEPAQIHCRELPNPRNRWESVAGWLRLDNANQQRLVGGTATFWLIADPTASPPGTYALLETENVIRTAVTGAGEVEIAQTIVIEHKPGAATG